MTWSDFTARIEAIAPGTAPGRGTRLHDLSPYQRARILWWVAELVDPPIPQPHLEGFERLGDLYDWLSAVGATEGRASDAGPQAPGSGARRVRLRPLLERDVMPLYLASFDPADGARWRYRGRTLPLDEFVGSLYAGVLCQFMVDLVATGETVGLVTAYDENRNGLNCKIAFVRCGPRAHDDHAAVFEGMVLLIGHLFANFPFRKLFAEVPSFNMGLFADDFAEHEGVLREYLFHDGRFVDLHLVSIRRDRWEELVDASGW